MHECSHKHVYCCVGAIHTYKDRVFEPHPFPLCRKWQYSKGTMVVLDTPHAHTHALCSIVAFTLMLGGKGLI
jgi:hypothetical protein